jgi:hypothetical protein
MHELDTASAVAFRMLYPYLERVIDIRGRADRRINASLSCWLVGSSRGCLTSRWRPHHGLVGQACALSEKISGYGQLIRRMQ